MIRTTVALFAFAVVVCGLIVFRPFAGGVTLWPGIGLAFR